jgi:hypothetical protein
LTSMMILPDATFHQQAPSTIDTIWSTIMDISFDPANFIPSTQSKIKVPPASQRLLEFGT